MAGEARRLVKLLGRVSARAIEIQDDRPWLYLRGSVQFCNKKRGGKGGEGDDGVVDLRLSALLG